MIDKTGESRTREDYEQALEAIMATLIDPPMDRPLLAVHLPIIKDGLELLIALMKVQEARKAKGS